MTLQRVRRPATWRLLVAVLAALWLLRLSGFEAVYAQTWESYRDIGRNTVWGTVANPFDGTYNIVYMQGTGYTGNANYNIGYYDGNGDLVASETSKASGNGTLKGQYALATDPNAAPGTWKSSAYLSPASPPPTYLGDGVGNDTFEVQAGAIPEFPTVLSSLGVATAAFVIYVLLRRRAVATARA